MAHTILLIEDDPLSARLADLLLSSEGYQVVVASDGGRGLEMARDQAPDLILLDLMLPGTDGFDVLSALRSDPRTADIQVVIVSSRSQPADKETATKIGADDYLTKPYRKGELLGIVHSRLSEKPGHPSSCGVCVLLVGPHGSEATPVALYTGLALAGLGEETVVLDLHPFSVEHAVLLGLPPRAAPAVLSDPDTLGLLAGLAVQHPGGLCLLNNLEGSGTAGQLTPYDAETALSVLLAGERFVLVDLPLYPAGILRSVAARCAQVALVVRGDPASSSAVCSALALMERSGVALERVGVIVVGGVAGTTLPGRELLAAIDEGTGPGAPVYLDLARHLQALRQAEREGDSART